MLEDHPCGFAPGGVHHPLERQTSLLNRLVELFDAGCTVDVGHIQSLARNRDARARPHGFIFEKRFDWTRASSVRN